MSSGCSRLLVANRGEIARRIFATAREMGIETVAVHSDGDRSAPFVSEADTAVALDGSTAAETYLDADKVLAAAAAAAADSVHPGYGFLSENADFASAVLGAGLTWVGPSPRAIAAMGDKLAAKALMVTAGVPTLPSVEIEATTDLAGAAADIGYPVLVKAAAGGGGKGMRVVEAEADLADAVAAAQREAEAAFGDGTVFLERYLSASRHVEIQVLGDTHGNVVHCFERECSIQRRHQKIIEEAPSPALTPALRSAMGAAALAAVRAIDYHSTGTVEFLLDASDPGAAEPDFYFLEVNTRLQVEHPVTEAVTGLDLVRQQILVARGEPLAFGQDDLAMDGCAIEARLYAEDAAAGFLPATGTVAAFAPALGIDVRIDSGVEAGSVVGLEFDPMLAKVIAHAPTRTEAANKLALALERLTIAGITTNRQYLVAALRSDAFLAGDTTTDFVDRVEPGETELAPEALLRLAAAAVVYRQGVNRAGARVLGFMRSGYRNSSMPPEQALLDHDGRELTIGYRSRRDGSFELDGGEELGSLIARELSRSNGSLEADIGGLRGRYDIVACPGTWHVQGPMGRADFVERSRFPEPGGGSVDGGQLAPMPGVVRQVAVEVGDVVEVGQTLVVMEAMKMEHNVAAPERATVTEVRCAVGDQVDNGEVLVVLAPA